MHFSVRHAVSIVSFRVLAYGFTSFCLLEPGFGSVSGPPGTQRGPMQRSRQAWAGKRLEI